MGPLHLLSIGRAGELLRSGSVTSVELTQAFLERIRAIDPIVHAFVRVTEERALSDAARADRELRAGKDRGPMHGIPYALKDVYDTAGIATTCHSWLRIDHVPEADCFIESRLREAGAVLLGKLSTHEFALGGPSFDLPFPPARNPWNPAHFTGGSSSGCGAAVAAGLARVTFGTDTSGSIRAPAFCCGVVGLKPTFGTVSRRGVFPLSYSLDHCGPVAATVEDAAIAVEVIAGYDPLDLQSVPGVAIECRSGLAAGVDGLRIGYPRHLFCSASDCAPEVIEHLDGAAELLARLGAEVHETRVPDFDVFSACGRVIMTAEGYAIHERDLHERPAQYGRYTYQRLIAGAAVSAADLLQAYRLRRELTVELNRGALREFDALITASGLAPAPRLDEFPEHWPPRNAMQTISFAVTGNPALAIPSGLASNGLPLGFQVVGRPFDEATVFRIAAAYERAAGTLQAVRTEKRVDV
jgi:aspartyl-tRNA(Asn)/glutamyl-tRNA(Gln) amidotransferase subunit A